MSREMAQKVIVPQKKIRSQSFLNSGTLVFLCTRVLLCTVVVFCCLLLGVLVCCCMLEGWGGLLVAMLCTVKSPNAVWGLYVVIGNTKISFGPAQFIC